MKLTHETLGELITDLHRALSYRGTAKVLVENQPNGINWLGRLNPKWKGETTKEFEWTSDALFVALADTLRDILFDKLNVDIELRHSSIGFTIRTYTIQPDGVYSESVWVVYNYQVKKEV